MPPTPAAALAAACKAFDAAAIARALRAGADPNHSQRGWTPLAALIQETAHGDEPAIEPARRLAAIGALLDGGAALELRSGFPAVEPLLLAALGGQHDVVALLIERGARVDDFAAAALGQRAALAKRLAKEPALAKARDPDGFTLLHFACGSRMGRDDARLARALDELVTLLLQAGADPNALGVARKAPLAPSYFAINARRFETTRLLLRSCADPTTALVTAVWNTKGEFARYGALCVEHGARLADARSAGRPLLNDLVRWGQFAPARWLLEQGADPNQPDADGFTALHQAASRGNLAMWESLLAAGGDPQRAAKDGTTPHQFAVRKKLVGVAKQLVAKARGAKEPMADPPVAKARNAKARRPTK
ncbi:MAG: ankyrin repeat domain-containing protein [Planctomycetes bacterium]|nr:ankyrin repeat domain-containing protein [Planctomycetota bacterium]